MPLIVGLMFDDANTEKMAAHGVTARQVLQVLDNNPWIGPNRKGSRAPFVMIGLDDGGKCITIPIEPVAGGEPDMWRPVTATHATNRMRSSWEGGADDEFSG